MRSKYLLLTGPVLGLFLFSFGQGRGQDREMSTHTMLASNRSSVSTSRLLHIDRDVPGGLPKRLGGQEPDTVRLLAVRVEFQQDEDPQTTGDGTFDLSTDSDIQIDPAPHNYAYFERHLRGLRNYYDAVSHGRLIIMYDLIPKESEPAVTLAHPMNHYATGENDSEEDSLLAIFFEEAITATDALNGQLAFSDYDSYLIFHAGAGRETDLGDTPKDIPSAFYNFSDLNRYLGDGDADYQGIAVKDGYVREGFWLPETESQDGYEFGLNGVAAHQFGYQLGLPSLFSTLTRRSGIGQWGLMDQGFGNESIRIPAQPCIWSKAFLGWVEAYEVRGTGDLEIAAWALDSGLIEAVKVDISSTEYFLIENRQRDVNGDDTVVKTIEEGVLVAVDEYDWGIPGSGLLIWHIDEKVIAARYEVNQVNGDRNHRGVDLEEADGVQEIGKDFGYIYGQRDDAFYAGNSAWAEANPHIETISFTPTSNPDSRSYSRTNSHIHVTDIGTSGPTMTLKVSIDTYQEGWPQFVGLTVGTNSPVFADVDDNDTLDVLFTSKAGDVFLWKKDGSKFIPNTDSLFSIDPKGDTIWVPIALFAETGDSIFASPALGDIDGDEDLEIIVSSTDGKVYAWHHTDQSPEDGRGDCVDGFPVDLGSEIRSSVVLADFDRGAQGLEMVAGTMAGRLYMIYADGKAHLLKTVENDAIRATPAVEDIDGDGIIEIVAVTQEGNVQVIGSDPDWTQHVESPVIASPVIGDIDHDGASEIVIVSNSGQIAVIDNSGRFLYDWPIQIGDSFESSPALGDIDGDGYLEIIVAGINAIHAFNYNGSTVPNWPVTVDRTDPVTVIQSSPVIGDVDGDGDLEIIVGSPGGHLLAYHHDGRVVDGFPLACGGEVNATPALLDADGDGDIEAMVGADDGYIYMWDVPGLYDWESVPWPMYAHDAQHTGAYPSAQLPPDIPEEVFFSEASVYNFPNPTEGNSTSIRYRLGEEASVRIKIFNLAGELVHEVAETGYPHTENEIQWDLTDIATGVYLCRVEASGSSGTKAAFCKIAVVK